MNPQDFESHPASCKFCRMPVTLRVHPDALGMFDLKVWVAMAACDRCADYHGKRLRITAAVQTIASKWHAAELTLNDADKAEASANATNALERLTRKLAGDASAHYRTGFTWEPDWVSQIMAQPDKATMTCTFFERQMWRDWRKRRRDEVAA